MTPTLLWLPPQYLKIAQATTTQRIGQPYGAVPRSLRTLSVRGAQSEMDSPKVREISNPRLLFSSYDHQAA